MDDEEEVLLALAETLATLLGHVGGPQYAPALMKPLQKLCAQEDITVREKATESLKKLLSLVSVSDHSAQIIKTF